MASIFANEFSAIAALTGKLHDIGKASQQFQDYLINGGARGSVVHSLQGAFSASDISSEHNTVFDVLLREILQLVIFAHHGCLPDAIDVSGDTIFFDKMADRNKEKYHYSEISKNIPNRDYNKIFGDAAAEISKLFSKIQKNYANKESANFAMGFFVKFIYSCLIDADRLDAFLFDTKTSYSPDSPDWDHLINVFDKKNSAFKSDTEINKIRSEISEKCKDASARETGIYRLSVPTGGGKTLSSLRFALNHARKHNKKRIIYIIPYLSITTQTAATIRDFLELGEDSNILLEHHSSVMMPKSEEENNLRKLASSRWDNPIIVSTMVQFLETVISSRGSDLRKFHNMQDSILIFDEIQSLPINCVHLFNEAVSFLAKILNTTILLCTATQPIIDQTNRRNLLLSTRPDLISDYNIYEKKLKRTNLVASTDEKTVVDLSQIVFEKAEENGNCLCIVNLKSEAEKMYKAIKAINISDDFEVVHLSTSMCGEHRRGRLDKIKSALINNEKLICVSTQLIEAGVDISFSCVIRAMAGLDSIMQAAGRCNRNGEFETIKNVYIYPIKDEKGLDKLKDIKMGKEITERVIRENPGADYMSEEILQKFYQYYFFERFKEMDYTTTNQGVVYEMLSNNCSGKENYASRTGNAYGHILSQAFVTASENFSVIPNLTKTVVVYYGDSEQLLDSFKEAKIDEKIRILHELQQYSVSLFDYEYQILEKKGAIALFDADFEVYLLDKNFYSSEYGVEKDAEMQNYIV